jgi:hypothetical protein
MPHPAFVGTWLLVSQHTIYPDGRVEITRGEHPRGVLIYDALGNMSVHLMRTDGDAERYTDLTAFETAMGGYHAYFGTYEVSEAEGIVRHFVVGAAYPPYRGSVQERHYAFDGDQLMLTVHATDGTQRVIEWLRARQKMS